jgi:uncharacterized membrane protein YdjX (TVP38/TMEM64 family)/rhodanese-related sulfurtransferase
MNTNKSLRLMVLLLLATGVVMAVVYRDQFDVAALQSWVQGSGVAAPLLFMLAYAIATVLFLPGSLLTLAGGALFGPLWGTLYNLTGATLGATFAFLIARYLAADWVASKASGKLQQMIEGVENEGWRFVAFVRLVPVFPFNLLNYALGLTRIRLWHYVLASYLCMLPGALAYTYLGYAGREAAAGGAGMIQKGLLALGLVALVAFLPRWIKRWRAPSAVPFLAVQSLREKLAQHADVLVLDVRGAAEFSGELGHIAGANNIAVEDLAHRLPELEAQRARAIVLVCRTDKRSAQAARLLRQAGFEHLAVLRGGMTEWNKAGLPVEKDRAGE